MNRKDLEEGYPLVYSCVESPDIRQLNIISSEECEPIAIPMTYRDIASRNEAFYRCLRIAGLTGNDKILGIFNDNKYHTVDTFQITANKTGSLFAPIYSASPSVILNTLRRFNADVLFASVATLTDIIDYAKGKEISTESLEITKIITGPETLTNGTRKHIEKEFACSTYNIMGIEEIGGLALGIECSEQDGIHVWDDNYIIEVVDYENGEPLADGEEGEMVITTLSREALPLIRYRTGRTTKIISREKCQCGIKSLKIAQF
jgi:phenylacetate-CoA ligase